MGRYRHFRGGVFSGVEQKKKKQAVDRDNVNLARYTNHFFPKGEKLVHNRELQLEQTAPS